MKCPGKSSIHRNSKTLLINRSFRISFEAEISKATAGIPSGSSISSPFIPSQVRTVIGSQTYNQVQQKLATVPSRIPPPPVPPFLPTYSTPVPQQQQHSSQHAAVPEKSYSTEPTPAVVSSAPKLYNARPTVGTLPKVDAPAAASSSIGPTISSTPVQSVSLQCNQE